MTGKKRKLFPKTFLYTFAMLLFITASIHLMIYFFYPKVYLNRMQKNLDQSLDTLLEEIKETGTDCEEKFRDFARGNNLNLTVTGNGRQTVYQGMNFQISLDAQEDMVFSLYDMKDAESVIIKNRTAEDADGNELQLNMVASAKPVREAVDMITFLLPYTFAATLIFAVFFSYLYSKKITAPILQMEKSKTVFLRSASHELKTPLAGLRILLENMQYNVGKYKDRDRYLAEAVRMVDGLNEMVKDILDVSGVADEIQEKQEDFSPGQELARLFDSYSLQAAGKNLKVENRMNEKFCIHGNKNIFRRVWSNLIGNAVQYTEEGGTVTVGTDGRDIWIENACEPLQKEELSLIFEPFYRSDRVRNRREGNGLGLYMVREMLEKEGASCRFEAVKDGMRFTVHYPKAKCKKIPMEDISGKD